MKINGRCLCGSVCFEVAVDPKQVFVCHCTDCQIRSGGTFRTIVHARSGTFRLTSGDVKLYIKTAQNGKRPSRGSTDSLHYRESKPRPAVALRSRVE